MQDISIAGIGTIQGGEYNNIKISGTGSVEGNIVANEIKISGAASFLGLVEGLVGLISSIRNKPKSYKNVISLVFSIVGFELSLIALLLTITNFIILVV